MAKMSSENLFCEPNLRILRKALSGRVVLSHLGEGCEMESADVYVVQSVLSDAGLPEQEDKRSLWLEKISQNNSCFSLSELVGHALGFRDSRRLL